jgi:3'-5' exoribonuclease
VFLLHDRLRRLDGPSRCAADLEERLDRLIDSVEDPPLRLLLRQLLDDPAYRAFPAAKAHHHAYQHGLLDHCVGMAELVDAAVEVFDRIDRDIAVAGALLHDIGKLEAYDVSSDGADLNDAGKLTGEIPLGYYRVRREIETIPDLAARRADALLHIILSHHGRLAYGSPVTPRTREATLVHAVDELSGRLGAFDRLEQSLAHGETWSRWDRVLDGPAYFADR